MTAPSSILGRRFRLLVAEDDQALREMIVVLLKADGYEVVAVKNGLELLSILVVSMKPESQIRSFDLVISDVRMPGTTGPRAFSQIGGGPEVPPVLFMTAFGDEELRDEAVQVGALAVLDKPVDFDDLRVFVKDYLTRRYN